MAYTDFSSTLGGAKSNLPETTHMTLHAEEGSAVKLPDASFVQDAHMTRDGMDLVLESPEGTIVVEGYFAAETAPQLIAPDGKTLTPDLVQSFLKSPMDYAQNGGTNDASPVGTVQEVTGSATVTRADGTTEPLTLGTPIYEGDIIETAKGGGVNIVFIDETSFAVSQEARLAIDEYVFDPATQSGEQNFSVLKGLFVFTSGLIGRDDPDDVHIQTPAGSIGIRGTIIAGNVDSGEITVVEGAIVLTDFQGHEVTLASQFETAKFTMGEGVQHVGQLSASDVAQRFSTVSHVSPGLFSVIQDAQQQQEQNNGNQNNGEGQGAEGQSGQDTSAPQGQGPAQPPAPPPGGNAGFGTGNGGFGAGDPAPGPGPQGGPAGPGPSGPNPGFGPGPGSNPPPPPQQPLGPPPGGQTTHGRPVFQSETPPELLMASEGQSRSYTFGKEFGPGAAGDTLVYSLDQATIAALNDWAANGILTGTQGTGWTFDAATGRLDLNFGTNFGITAGAMDDINIIVRATDQHGNTVTGSHVFEAYNQSADVTNYTGTNYPTPTNLRTETLFDNIDGKVIARTGTGGTDNLLLDLSDNNRIFMGDNDSNIQITNTSHGNYIHLGNGLNSTTIEAGTHSNTIVGGDQGDKFTLQTAKTHVYGGQGDDTFVLDLGTAGNTVLSDLASGGLILDGGIGLSNAEASLRGLSGSYGAGDTLNIAGGGNLDFSALLANNQIRGIDMLDFAATGGTDGVNTVDLTLQDVIQMSDPHRTLVIRLGANDVLNLAGFDGFTRSEDNRTLDADGSGSDYGNESYDVYTNGSVTILILQDGTGDAGTVNGI